MRNKRSSQRDFIISGKFDEYYKTESIESMTTKDNFDLAASDIQAIYNRYNQLANREHSIERNLLGYGGDANGIEDELLPIYEYVIYPPETTQKTHGEAGNTDLYPSPTILITTGVHGNEKAAVYGAYEFAKQLINNPQNSRGLNDLKSNFTFKIIPIVNPGGYNRQIRNNLREVDLNRNFVHGWKDLGHPFKGVSVYSEVETQLVKNWLAKNKEAFAYLDYHNFTRIGESIDMPERKPEMTSYHLSPNEGLDKMYSSLIRRLSHEWRNSYLKNYSYLENVAFGFVYSDKGREIPSTISEAFYTHGIELAAIPEITYNDPITPKIMNTQTVMELSAEFFINYVLTLVDCFKKY